MKKIILNILLVFLLFISCKNTKKELHKNEILKQDKTKIDQIIEKEKEEKIELILKDSIGVKLKNNKTILNKAEWNNLGYEKIEKFNQDFNYSIIGKIKYKNGEITLIERDYIEESIHWVILTNMDNTINFIQSAYENSEGFSTIKSEIFFDKIIIKEWNIYSENEYKEEIYYLTKKRFVKKVL